MAAGAVDHDTDQQTSRSATVGFHREECGSTAVEYGILVAALGVGLVAVGPALADAVIAFLDVVLGHVPGVS